MPGLFAVISGKTHAIPQHIEVQGAEAIEAELARQIAHDQEAERLFGGSPTTEEE